MVTGRGPEEQSFGARARYVRCQGVLQDHIKQMFGLVPVFRKGLIHYSGLVEVREEAEGDFTFRGSTRGRRGPQQVAQI